MSQTELNTITRPHTPKMHTVYTKLQTIHTHDLSYMFQGKITVLRGTLMKTNIKLTHPVNKYNAKSN